MLYNLLYEINLLRRLIMIEIIERHDPKEFEKKYKFTCSKCHTVAIITEDEIKVETQYNETYARFKCPICHKSFHGDSRWSVLRKSEFEEYKAR